MADDLMDNLLELEEGFFKEGYDIGLADGNDAGRIEGKIFGIEKGFEKALEMGRLHGRGQVWNQRLPKTSQEGTLPSDQEETAPKEDLTLDTVGRRMGALPDNSRIRKHIEALLNATDGTFLVTDNSDEAVADFDERMIRANAKAKVISQILGEPVHPVKLEQSGIEDSNGLSARH